MQTKSRYTGSIGKVTLLPEFNLAFFAFLLHFVWEFAQMPAYAGTDSMSFWEGLLDCSRATFGDVGFSLLAFWVTAAVAENRLWILAARGKNLVIFILVGLGLTVFFEWYYTEVSARWAYSELMPRLPFLGTGLAPFLQWILIPPTVVWIVRRQLT